MASNETVADIVREMKECEGFRAYYDGGKYHESGDEIVVGVDLLHDYADSIEAAHKREIAAKDAEIAKLNAKCKEYERQPELMAETAREALRTLQEQDAEIAELRQRIKEADEFAAEMKESTNSLVRACGHQMILRLREEGANGHLGEVVKVKLTMEEVVK